MNFILITFIILFSGYKSLAQSISIREIETFLKQPIKESEQTLFDKSFTLTDIKLNGNDSIKTYQKASESIKLGRIWYRSDRTKFRDVTYMTPNKVATVYLLSELEDLGFKYKSDEYNTEQNGRFIFLETSEYSAEVFISASGNDNLIKLVEK